MLDLIGWAGTGLVLLGYLLNARRKHIAACAVWIVGDVAWIIYDIEREIYPHLGLSSVIILINLYAIVNMWTIYIKKKK